MAKIRINLLDPQITLNKQLLTLEKRLYGQRIPTWWGEICLKIRNLWNSAGNE